MSQRTIDPSRNLDKFRVGIGFRCIRTVDAPEVVDTDAEASDGLVETGGTPRFIGEPIAADAGELGVLTDTTSNPRFIGEEIPVEP